MSLTLSYSRIRVWKSCHYDHYQKYVNKLVPKKKSPALIRGSIIHECLEAYYNGKSWKKVWQRFADEFYEEAFEEEIESLGDIPYMAKELLEAYFHFYEKEDEGTEYLNNELHFELPLIDDINLEGYIDAIIEDEDGKIWVKDYKTFRSMPEYNSLRFNYQSAIYMWALREMGYEVEGMIWDIVTAKTPSKPQLLKDGSVSKRKLDSNPYTVRKGIIELGLDPNDYLDLIHSVKYENYFHRFKIRYNQNLVDALMEDIKQTALEIRDNGDRLKDMNLETKFKSSYMDLWQAEVMNSDVEFIIDNHFERRETNGKKNKGDRK